MYNGNVGFRNNDAIVNSPSTTVIVRNAAPDSAEVMLGTTIRTRARGVDAPSDRAASSKVRRSIARNPASSDRNVNGIARMT
jgi:hypothetical protein